MTRLLGPSSSYGAQRPPPSLLLAPPSLPLPVNKCNPLPATRAHASSSPKKRTRSHQPPATWARPRRVPKWLRCSTLPLSAGARLNSERARARALVAMPRAERSCGRQSPPPLWRRSLCHRGFDDARGRGLRINRPRACAPPVGLEPTIFGLEVQRLVH